MNLRKRDFLAAGAIGLGLGIAGNALAQPAGGSAANAAAGRRGGRGAVPHRMAKTTILFKSPAPHPNAIATQADGLLWVGEQRDRPSPGAPRAPAPSGPAPREQAWLLDWNGKVLKTVATDSQNTSGMAFWDDCVWMVSNGAPFGVFQTDMNSKTVSHRQIPLGLPDNGGGAVGACYANGKFYVNSTRLRGILRIDAKTWAPEFLIPIDLPEGSNRLHGITWDNGAIWLVTGNDSTGFATGKPGLAKYDATTAELLETVEFVPGSADPHGLAIHNGTIVSCDAGLHPGWQNNDSPFVGSIFSIDFI